MSLPHEQPPYLSVVVTMRSDDDRDEWRDPVERLQGFVRWFDEQCRRTALEAEVIVVDWNRPPERSAVADLLRLPEARVCTYRFIDVPPAVHGRLRHGDTLPAFPMIARNVGVRRARGRFVLATSVDVIFPTELIAFLASRALMPGYLYRTDRRDVDAEVPFEAPLETALAYCATHQRVAHARSGSYPVDGDGAMVPRQQDIVDGRAARLGDGWHVREGDARTGFFRWARHAANIVIDAAAVGARSQALEIEVEANPYDPRAWVNLEVLEGDRAISRAHVTGRMRLNVPLEPASGGEPRRIELRVTATHAKPRLRLPLFERRDDLSYRVFSVTLRPLASDGSMIVYPLSGWSNANPKSPQTVVAGPDGLMVTTDSPKWSYSMHFGMLRAPASRRYRFDVSCRVLDGRVLVGVLSGGRSGWLPASVAVQHEARGIRFHVSVDLARNQPFWVMVYNDHPDGVGASRFVLMGLSGSVDPAQLAGGGVTGLRSNPFVGRGLAAAEQMSAPLWRFLAEAASARKWRERASVCAGWGARVVRASLPSRLLGRIVRADPEYQSIERAFNIADDALKGLAPLRDLEGLRHVLCTRRPDNLHLNGCGDFQLMAREHWHDLHGYPELEAFSQHIDGLLAFIADASGIKEQMLAMPIYYRATDPQSRPSQDDDAVLRRRASERAVPKLDAGTVSIWASEMQWLKRPILLNRSNWGLGSVELDERTATSAVRSTT